MMMRHFVESMAKVMGLTLFLSLSSCGGGDTPATSPPTPTTPTPPPATSPPTDTTPPVITLLVKLNDTGITTCSNATANGLACPQVGFPGQDAELGRDAYASLVKAGGGSAGFDFTKLDAAGLPLTNQAVLYANTPWNCVQDHVTGLMWEIKTTAGAGGLRDANHRYTWFNSDPYTNGGNAGTANGGLCVDGLNCDTEKYVAAVNAAGWCGFSDWRLPNKEELHSIVDYSIAWPGPMIDVDYFPNTIGSGYWSSSPNTAFATDAWFVGFGNGGGADFKSLNLSVRLVRSGQ